jgi:hypothetical protein
MDGVAFRAWWTLATRLDRLRADRLITQAAYAAACRLRADCGCVAATSGSRMDRLGDHVAGDVGDAPGQMLGRLAAMRRLRLIRARLGTRSYALAYWCVVGDAAWSAKARRLGVSDRTVRTATAAAIEELVELR